VFVKMIVITAKGIRIRASDRIMSPAVACLLVRATSLIFTDPTKSDRRAIGELLGMER
jgi:hypothetical protein